MYYTTYIYIYIYVYPFMATFPWDQGAGVPVPQLQTGAGHGQPRGKSASPAFRHRPKGGKATEKCRKSRKTVETCGENAGKLGTNPKFHLVLAAEMMALP